MEFFGIKNSIDDFKDSYSTADKAKSVAKIFGIAVANTAIFAGKTVVAVAGEVEKKKEQLEKQRK